MWVIVMLLFFVGRILGHVCRTEVATPNGSFVAFLDCSPVFEVCCYEGCCARFSHAHIWVFTATITFVIFVCIFGCWLFCCKNMRRNRGERPLVESPLTPVTTNHNTNDVPITPPPSYEEATAMR